MIDADTVREHRRRYLTTGVAGVERPKYDGTEPSLDAEQLEALGAEMDAHLYTTEKAVCVRGAKLRHDQHRAGHGQGIEAASFRLHRTSLCRNP